MPTRLWAKGVGLGIPDLVRLTPANFIVQVRSSLRKLFDVSARRSSYATVPCNKILLALMHDEFIRTQFNTGSHLVNVQFFPYFNSVTRIIFFFQYQMFYTGHRMQK